MATATSQLYEVFRYGNSMRVSPVDDYLRRVAEEELRYIHKRVLMTAEERRNANGRSVELTPVDCYSLSLIGGRTQLVTASGYLSRLAVRLRRDGQRIKVYDPRPVWPEGTFTPDWDRLSQVVWKPFQRETLEAMAGRTCGRVHWATGSGKSWLLPHFCRLFPAARFLITTYSKQVNQMLYERLSRELPSVSMHSSSGKAAQDRRIICVTSGSMHHFVAWHPHFLVADEVHELGTAKMVDVLMQFRNSRRFGLSANCGDRTDGGDHLLEGVFGPVVATLTYQDATEAGMIPPIDVHWLPVSCDDPAAGKVGAMLHKFGIWRNRYRNRVVAAAANTYAEDGRQVLVTVATMEHAAELKRLLPDFELCYGLSGDNGALLDEYFRGGLLPQREPTMTEERQRITRQRFERGELRKVIATTVWKRGVSFDALNVLVRADASSSEVDCTQIPGRLARWSDGKTNGILVDFEDSFNETLANRANSRRRSYWDKGWRQFDQDGQELVNRYGKRRSKRR